MANDVTPGDIQAARPVQGSRAPTSSAVASGKPQPPSGAILPRPVATQKVEEPPRAVAESDTSQLAARLSEFLRESGRPVMFKVQDQGGRMVVQEIDPDSGEVIGELTSDNLLALAHGLGISGLVVDSRA